MAHRNERGRFTAVKEKTLTTLTLSQAVEYLKPFDAKMNKTKLTRILAAPRNSVIFATAITRTHFHDEVPDLIEIDQAALDQFMTARTANKVGNRATRAGQDRKWLMYIPDARIEEFRSLVTRAGFNEPKAAYKPKARATTPVVPQEAPANLVEELIEA